MILSDCVVELYFPWRPRNRPVSECYVKESWPCFIVILGSLAIALNRIHYEVTEDGPADSARLFISSLSYDHLY